MFVIEGKNEKDIEDAERGRERGMEIQRDRYIETDRRICICVYIYERKTDGHIEKFRYHRNNWQIAIVTLPFVVNLSRLIKKKKLKAIVTPKFNRCFIF